MGMELGFAILLALSVLLRSHVASRHLVCVWCLEWWCLSSDCESTLRLTEQRGGCACFLTLSVSFRSLATVDESTPSPPQKVLLLFLSPGTTLASDTWLCPFLTWLNVACM